MTALVHLDAARRTLAEVSDIPGALGIRDRAEALRVWAKAANEGIEKQNEWAEIKLRAERKAGELLAEMPKHPPGRYPSHDVIDIPPKLADLGISLNDSSRWQQVASLPDDAFEQHIAETKGARAELTTARMLELAKEFARGNRAVIRSERESERQARPVQEVPALIECGDATELPLDSNTVDLIVTSPPYGIDKPYLDSDDSPSSWEQFMCDWLDEAYRVATDGGRLAVNVPLDTTAPTPRASYAICVRAAMRAGWQYRFTIVWNEDNVTRSVARGSVDSASAPHVIARVEMVAVFYKGAWRRDPPCESDLDHDEWLNWTNGLWTFSGEGRAWGKHPAAFPVELPYRLIKLLSFPGDAVLDPFLGSGTSTLVAHRLGRAPIGFDISPEYVESARRRLAADLEASRAD